MAKEIYLLLLISVISNGATLDEQNEMSDAVTTDDNDTGERLTLLRYLLWTRYNARDDDYYILEPQNLENLEASHFNAELVTYVLHPGWLSPAIPPWILEGKTNLLNWKDCNVISIDWEQVLTGPSIERDLVVMYEVSMKNAEFLDWLVRETMLTTGQIEIVGHSLGGQSAGMTAKFMTTGRVARVTGLDPENTFFYNKTAEERLDKTQADFVDIIHTNACPSLLQPQAPCVRYFGSFGHADFWPNGGLEQPGCNRDDEGYWRNYKDYNVCNHLRAPFLWTESILYAANSSLAEGFGFKSWSCSDWQSFAKGLCYSCEQGCQKLGIDADRSLRGNFYLRTRGKSPFALELN